MATLTSTHLAWFLSFFGLKAQGSLKGYTAHPRYFLPRYTGYYPCTSVVYALREYWHNRAFPRVCSAEAMQTPEGFCTVSQEDVLKIDFPSPIQT